MQQATCTYPRPALDAEQATRIATIPGAKASGMFKFLFKP
jgi:hypothetical protein